ncbi:MAG: STAS/SEC14 domain-containing protein [Thermoplasmata archaeon]|nr:STAS/SEC14 domain-containing protein [Thermoplasmata archaeon]
MFQRMDRSLANAVGYRIVGKIRKEDFEAFLPQVRALVDQFGSIRLLLDLSDYDGIELKAWFSDAKFGKEFHKDLEKMAIVGDKRWNKWITSLSRSALSGQAKFFNEIDIESAWMWLKE